MPKRLILIALAGLLGFSACTSSTIKTVPDQIQGHWVTTAPGYETRYLQLERDFVLIGIAQDETPSIQRVYRVEQEGNGRQMTYKIYSTGAETDYTLTVYYDPGHGGEIRLKNGGGMVWKRAAVTP